MGLWKRRRVIRVSRTAFNTFCECNEGGNLYEGKMLDKIRQAEDWLKLTYQPNYHERAARTRKYISELEEILTAMRNGYPVEVEAYD